MVFEQNTPTGPDLLFQNLEGELEVLEAVGKLALDYFPGPPVLGEVLQTTEGGAHG